LPASPPAVSLSLHPAAPAPASAPARAAAAFNFGCWCTASRCDSPTLNLTRKDDATASLPLQPALPTSMRSSDVACFFDLLGWHLTLTPSITNNDAALHLEAMATKQLRRPPGRPMNCPVRENATTKMSIHHSFFTDRPGGRAPRARAGDISDEKCNDVDIL